MLLILPPPSILLCAEKEEEDALCCWCCDFLDDIEAPPFLPPRPRLLSPSSSDECIDESLEYRAASCVDASSSLEADDKGAGRRERLFLCFDDVDGAGDEGRAPMSVNRIGVFKVFFLDSEDMLTLFGVRCR